MPLPLSKESMLCEADTAWHHPLSSGRQTAVDQVHGGPEVLAGEVAVVLRSLLYVKMGCGFSGPAGGGGEGEVRHTDPE